MSDLTCRRGMTVVQRRRNGEIGSSHWGRRTSRGGKVYNSIETGSTSLRPRILPEGISLSSSNDEQTTSRKKTMTPPEHQQQCQRNLIRTSNLNRSSAAPTTLHITQRCTRFVRPLVIWKRSHLLMRDRRFRKMGRRQACHVIDVVLHLSAISALSAPIQV